MWSAWFVLFDYSSGYAFPLVIIKCNAKEVLKLKVHEMPSRLNIINYARVHWM